MNMKEEYEWRFCPICLERIFKDEIEGDTIQTVEGTLYCYDCGEDRKHGKEAYE